MSDTKIEWADKVWNPVTGCTPISEGCANCYAARMAKRLAGRYGYPKDEPFSVTSHPNKLDEPYHWLLPQKVFVCSMGDLFHENVGLSDLWQIHSKMRLYGRPDGMRKHTFMILTKRPQRMAEFYRRYPSYGFPDNPNLWIGVTAENQRTADERIPILLQIPAAKRFVSVEPMLGPVDLTKYFGGSLDEQSFKREGYLPSSSGRGIGDRQSGENMEAFKKRVGQMEQESAPEQMQEGQSRTFNPTGISSGSRNGQQETSSRRSTPSGLLPLLRGNTEGNDGQPQERVESRQQTGELGTGNLFRANTSCDKGTGFSSREGCSGTIQWCIVGPETGPRARPTSIDWVRDLQRQCAGAGVPFFDKKDVLGETIQEWPR